MLIKTARTTTMEQISTAFSCCGPGAISTAGMFDDTACSATQEGKELIKRRPECYAAQYNIS